MNAAYVTAPLRSMFLRARRAALARGLALLGLGVALCLGLHVLQPAMVAEAALNGGVALLLALRGARL